MKRNFFYVSRKPKMQFLNFQKLRIELDQERAKNRVLQPICNVSMMHGGINHEDHNCYDRHAILKDDIVFNSSVPRQGLVRLQFTRFISPTYYSVRLIEHYKDGKWIAINRSNEFAEFADKFKAYYENKENLPLHTPIEAGNLCLVMRHNKPHRAKVIKVYSRR